MPCFLYIGLEKFWKVLYNGNMKNKLPRKYKITCRVCKAECAHHNGVRNVGRLYQADNDNHRRVRRFDAPENLVSSRYVGMHNGFADDSRRVCRSDAPENVVSPRYVDRHNWVAGDTKTAETLVLSGFPPYRLKNNLYQRHKLKLVN